jgi:hypothetical protein
MLTQEALACPHAVWHLSVWCLSLLLLSELSDVLTALAVAAAV